MRRDLKDPASAPAFGSRRRSALARAAASPRVEADQARRRGGGVARTAMLALACGLLAMLLLAGTAGAAAPTQDPVTPSFDGSGTPDRSMTPTYVSVSQRSGDVYVIDSAHDAVDVFDANGNYLSQILGSSTTARSFSFGGTDDIAVDNSGGATDGRVYVESQTAGLVFAFDASGNFLWQSSAGNSGPGGFAAGIAVDPSGNPWLGDPLNGIQELSQDGSTAAAPIPAPGMYANLAFDSAGNIAGVEYGGGVDVFDQSGNLLHSDHTGNVNDDVAVETVTNSVYTVDATGVTIWDSSGNQVAGTPFGPVDANSVTVNASNGKVYITEPSQGRVDIYDLQLYTLGVTANGTGSGRVDADTGRISGCTSSGGTCSDRYIAGSTVTLVAAPDSGSNFTGWTGCDSPSGNTCTVNVTSDRGVTATFDAIPRPTLRVELSGTGSGTVTSAPGGISCGPTCQSTFLEGTLILLTPRAAAGSTFTGWSGGCSGTAPCQLTLNADTDVTAIFAQSPPTVSTGGASGITETAATLSGTVNANGAATACTFEYGTTTSYGASVPCAAAPGSGTNAVAASAALSGLTAATTYHYRIDASNSGGPSTGSDATFTTAVPSQRTCQTDRTLCPKPGVLQLAKATVVASGGKVVVQLSCVGGTTCRGSLKVTAKIKTVSGKGRKRKTHTITVVVAKGSVQIGAGRSARVTLRLTSTGKHLLARTRQLKTTLAGAGLRHTLVIKNGAKKKAKKHR